MARGLVSVLEKKFGKTFYVNLWIATSLGLVSQIIGYTKYEGYFDLYWIIMKDGFFYFNLYPSLNELSFVLFIRVFLVIFVWRQHHFCYFSMCNGMETYRSFFNVFELLFEEFSEVFQWLPNAF